ncbi:dynamin family protein [Tessaracoccus palaemonis]|uniref:Dynamin family protein n=1 Tax=Tessaracoccus palaemonis TaxID=2829499 RepID=A0ABX8SMA0_9ACTN|nr:dynamin family protein [Tessaracoccus palaemonis]QXT63760.1 dynamin family protein [Tessaracoccus palaemonis]
MSGAEQLTAAFRRLDATLPLAQFPLPIEGAEALRSLAGSMAHQVRDYLLPRAARLDAPLLAVVGGSTGAGKSTLVNSILRSQVTRPGVLRPTTKSPVLVCHPSDEAWFRTEHVLPDLVRTDTQLHDSRALHIVATEALPPGLALLDAPDIDSIDDANRSLARQLLFAADLWLFVTSAARYADAVPWEYLATAAERNTVVAVIVNRCPPGALSDIGGHLAQLLSERGLPQAKLFAVAERALPSDGMVPPGDVSGIRQWLGQLTSESGARAQVAVQSLAGSVRSLDAQLTELTAGVQRQRDALAELRRETVAPYQRAAAAVAEAAGDGSLLRGEILSRWQDLVGTGEFMRSVEERISAIRDRISGWFKGEPKVEAMEVAIADSLTAVLLEAGERAAEETAASWSLTRWGRDILSAAPHLQRASEQFPEAAAAAIRAWQTDVLSLVEQQGRGKRMKARFLAIGTNVVGAALIIVVFASTGGLTTAEIGIAGGTSLLAQRLLEAVFGEDAVRRLAEHARRQLHDRVDDALADEAARYIQILETLSVAGDATEKLQAAAADLRDAARAAFDDLTAPELT